MAPTQNHNQSLSIQRDFRLDLLRVFSIILIVFMHSPKPGSVSGFILSGLSYVTASGLVLFFMISGALLLGTRLSTREFLLKRFSKILVPTLVWTFFYLAVKYMTNPPSATESLRQVLSIPFSRQGCGALWFMYTLSGLYLLTPVLSRWLEKASKREIEFYLILWSITLIYPYLEPVLFIDTGINGVLYYFSGYVGYFLLGYYLRHHYDYRLWHVFVAVTIVMIIPVLLYSRGGEVDFYSMLWYHSLPVAAMAFLWYVLASRLPNKRLSLIEEASKLTFGVYFVHVFFLTRIVWKIDALSQLPGIIQIVAIATMTIIFSYLCSWLLSRLPFSKFIIGV